MTACVAIAPEARMDNSSCDNLHGCLTDSLDPSFRPGVGLLEADVISAYMTAAVEIAQREEREASTFSPDLPRREKEEYYAATDKSDSFRAKMVTQDAESREQPAPNVSKNLGILEHEGQHGTSEKLNEISAQDQLKAAVRETGTETPTRDNSNVTLAEVEPSIQVEVEGSRTMDGCFLPSSGVSVDSENVVEESFQHVNSEIRDVQNSGEDVEIAVAKPEPVVASEDVEVSKNLKVGDEDGAEMIESAVTREETTHQNDIVVESPALKIHAQPESTTTTSDTLEIDKELTVPESNASSSQTKSEDVLVETAISTESPTNLLKSHPFEFTGLNHVALCCESLERSLEFYCGLLGLKTNLDRPELPYRGAWLLLGAEGIHIMEVPNPDPVKGRPPHGGYDRHACLNVKNVDHLRMTFDKAGINYQLSMVPSIFCRDPDGNGLEFIEVNSVHVD